MKKRFDVRDLGGAFGYYLSVVGRQLWLLEFVWSYLDWFLFLRSHLIFMVVFVWSGLCICLPLSMGLRPLCWLRIACVSFVPPSPRVVWFCRQPLASIGAVLSLLDGAHGV